jgi:hypothetical protein
MVRTISTLVIREQTTHEITGSQFPDDEGGDVPRNIDSLTIKQSDAAARARTFYAKLCNPNTCSIGMYCTSHTQKYEYPEFYNIEY